MSEEAELVRAVRLRALRELAEGPSKPSYSLDGQQVRWTEFQDHLLRRIAWCDRRLAACEPFEFRSSAE